MKITIYNVKWGAGKTPIATNIVLDRQYALWTNEPYHILDTFIPEERLITVASDEPFPEIPDDIDIIFDLAGSISKNAHSITSSLQQSDLVIIPIFNEIKCLTAWLHTILEVANFNKNIIVIATKLIKQKGDMWSNWKNYSDFKNIENLIKAKIDFDVRVLPLKFSKAFDLIFEKEKLLSTTQTL